MAGSGSVGPIFKRSHNYGGSHFRGYSQQANGSKGAKGISTGKGRTPNQKVDKWEESQEHIEEGSNPINQIEEHVDHEALLF